MLKATARIALLTLLIVVLVPAGPAGAKSPPRGSYTCSKFAISGTQYFGILRILKKNRYSVNRGKVGKFKMSGKKITWKTGVYKGVWRSKVRRARGTDRTLTIGHFAWQDRKFEEEEVSCYRDD